MKFQKDKGKKSWMQKLLKLEMLIEDQINMTENVQKKTPLWKRVSVSPKWWKEEKAVS